MKFICLIFCSLIFFSVSAQKLDDLQSEIEDAEREIERINLYLESNRQQQLKSDERVKLLEKRLEIRQSLVRQTNLKINILESNLRSCDKKVLLCEAKIDSIKNVLSTLSRTCNLSFYSDDSHFENLYLKMIVEQFNKSVQILDSTIQLTGVTRSQISSQKKELELLQYKRKAEVKQMLSETQQLDDLRRQLKIGESAMLSQIEAQRTKINLLQREIERIISIDNSNNLSLDFSVSSAFLLQQGKLPSPLSASCKIIDEYGIHNHPTIKGVKISNKGVNLAFKGSSDVLSIFDGEVRGVYSIAGMANTILIRHGKYISVYANLSSVSVKKGDKVSSGQIIGRISSVSDSDLFLHFELWKESSTLNPSLWINFK